MELPDSESALLTGVSGVIFRAATPEAPNGTVETLSIPYGTKTKVALSDGDVFSVEKMVVGTKYEIAEDNLPANYTLTEITENNTTLSSSDTSGLHPQVKNEFDDSSITPTGIIVNNLPFVLVVVLAIGGIVVFFMANRRRREEEN